MCQRECNHSERGLYSNLNFNGVIVPLQSVADAMEEQAETQPMLEDLIALRGRLDRLIARRTAELSEAMQPRDVLGLGEPQPEPAAAQPEVYFYRESASQTNAKLDELIACLNRQMESSSPIGVPTPPHEPRSDQPTSRSVLRPGKSPPDCPPSPICEAEECQRQRQSTPQEQDRESSSASV